MSWLRRRRRPRGAPGDGAPGDEAASGTDEAGGPGGGGPDPAGRPPTLSEADDRLLAELAGRIVRRGLAAPAVLWLESLRPVSFLGSQAMHFLRPFVEVLGGPESFGRLAAILEERAHLERFLRHIEEIDAGRPAPGPEDPA